MFKSYHSKPCPWWIPILYSHPGQQSLHLAVFVNYICPVIFPITKILCGALQCWQTFTSSISDVSLWSIYTLFIIISRFFCCNLFSHLCADLICIGSFQGRGRSASDETNFLLFLLHVSNGSSNPLILSHPRAAGLTVYSLYACISYILYIIFLKNLLITLFQQHQHIVTLYIPFTTIHLGPVFQV